MAAQICHICREDLYAKMPIVFSQKCKDHPVHAECGLISMRDQAKCPICDVSVSSYTQKSMAAFKEIKLTPLIISRFGFENPIEWSYPLTYIFYDHILAPTKELGLLWVYTILVCFNDESCIYQKHLNHNLYTQNEIESFDFTEILEYKIIPTNTSYNAKKTFKDGSSFTESFHHNVHTILVFKDNKLVFHKPLGIAAGSPSRAVFSGVFLDDEELFAIMPFL